VSKARKVKTDPVDCNASILSAFIRNKTAPKSGDQLAVKKDIDQEGDNGDEAGADEREEMSVEESENELLDHWLHFRPLKTMRLGCPYHELSVKDKLVILEFLIDELLSIQEIAAEFSQRRAKTACYHYPYGALPSKEELENLENEDECGICGKEGDLLCCDGCENSYHKKCLGMPELGVLPEGEWLCNECELKDPAYFGPLRRGRKSALEWFAVDDLEEAAKAASGGEKTSSLALKDTSEGRCRSARKLLVIQGFVFASDKNDNSTTMQLFSASGLQKELKTMGPELCGKWPVAQIPFDASKLFDDPLLSKKSPFFFAADRFDPSFYYNQYRKAPLPPTVRKVKDSHLQDYESRCTPVVTTGLSSVLNAVMTNDQAVADFLRSSRLLFDPYKTIALYLFKLEAQLLKASLVGEFWKTTKTSGEEEAWSCKVRDCKSIRRLSALLLQLLDATHPLAFLDGWFDSVRSKGESPSVNNKRTSVGNVFLPADFSENDESLRRHWERAPMPAIPQLIARTSMSVGDWIREMRPDLASRDIRKGKRKHAGGKGEQAQLREESTSTPFVEKKKGEDEVQDSCKREFAASDPKRSKSNASPEIGSKVSIEKTASSDENNKQEANAVDKSEDPPSSDALDSHIVNNLRHRRSVNDGDAPHAASDATLSEVTKATGMSPGVAAQARERVAEFESELNVRMLPENILWPIAGRKLFDPPGTLPKPIVRYLARNAGGVAAPHVTYSSTYEVGEISFCHIFRKRVSNCSSFEEFIVLLRTLEGFLDHEVSSQLFSFVLALLMGSHVSHFPHSVDSQMYDYFATPEAVQGSPQR